MPIGKDSITKRVAKQAEPAQKTETPAEEKNIAPELVATVATPKSPAKKKATATGEKKPSSNAKKPTAKKTETVAKVDTAVIANIAPETVAAVIGHEEKSGSEKVQIGEKMPVYLL